MRSPRRRGTRRCRCPPGQAAHRGSGEGASVMRGFRVPNPLTLLVGCTIIAAALTYIIPAGEYDRRSDPATGRSVVVSGTFHRVAADPVGLFGAAVAIPRGMIDAAAVV